MQTRLPSRSPLSDFVEGHGNSTGNPILGGQGLSPSRHKAATSGDPALPTKDPLFTPPLGSSDSPGWSEGSPVTPVRYTRDLTSAASSPLPVAAWPPDPNPRSPALQAAWSSGPDSVATAGHPPNASVTQFSTPPSRSTRSVATPPGLAVGRSVSGTPHSSDPPLTPSARRSAPGWSTPGIVTSTPQGPGEGAGSKPSTGTTLPAKAGGSFSSASLPVSPTGQSEGSDHLQTSRDSALSDAAQGIHLLLNPPEMPDPSQGPFVRPHTTTRVTPEPTLAPPEEFYPTHTMDDDWGSGDYLETMSFMGPEGEDFSLATSLPTDMYDQEDWSTEVYDTSFPSRIVPPLSSLHIPISPTFTTAYGGGLRSADPSTPRPSQGRPSPATSPSGSDEGSDLDWTDTYTIEPTEILLPDMNSLEYYTTLLAKENASAAQRNLTSSGHLPPTSLVTPHISPTSSLPAGLVPTAPANGSVAEESSGEESGSGVPNFTATDAGGLVRPHLENGSESALEPSVAPTPSMTLSTSLWGGQVSTVPTPLPGATSSSAYDRPATSQGLDGQWLISATSTETALRPTASATTHATPALTTPALSPTVTGSPTATTGMADQSATTETATTGSDSRQTTAKDTEPASTTASRQTTPLTTTTVGLVTSKIPLSTAGRQYLCNITKPETYLVRAGKSYRTHQFDADQLLD